MTLQVSDEVLDRICIAGFDPVYGARPLKRSIQQLLENPLAEQLLEGRFVAGDTIVAALDGDAIRFVTNESATHAA